MDFSNWSTLAIVGFVLLILWSAVWEAIALWKAARAGSVTWFVIFLLIHTAGILEIIYIFWIAPKQKGCCENLDKK